ncbi:phosphopyruvate hydratase [Candidatus Woesearchaeota archaeon]|nr:phosphopyruvate hydratase [Candidatus Woesearchaeota archaeon]
MARIKKIYARQILDSRATPTIEVELWTEKNHVKASVPSGKSKGRYEAVELRDNNEEFFGLSVRRAVDNINKIIAKRIKGMRASSQELIDGAMIRIDATSNKSRLGANAILAVSMAVAKAAARDEEKPLWMYLHELFGRKNKPRIPTPFANIINGGVHAGNDLAFQEFMIVPIRIKNFEEKVRAIVEIYQYLKNILEKRYGRASINVGDEGGFVPPIKKPENALDLLVRAIDDLGYSKGVFLAIDVAASELYKNGKYYPLNKNLRGKALTSRELLEYYKELAKSYPIISLEDGFSQDDYPSWKMLKKKLGTNIENAFKTKKMQIVGDDLLATNPERIRMAIREGLCNALLLKINQIGTLTEALEAARIACMHHWGVMVSHRSGETNDPFIAHLAVGLGCGQIKIGAPARGERVAKYNELLRISEELE